MLKCSALLLSMLLSASAVIAQEAIVREEAPPKEQAVPKLPGTTWSGDETLKGFGKLVFQFKDQGVVTMIDARKEPVDGRFKLDANEVTISFRSAEYVGRIVAGVLSGSAEFTAGKRKGESWKWSVRLQTLVAKPGIDKDARTEVVAQGFPAESADPANLAKSDTAWEIEWDLAPVEGKQVKLFRIASAKFMWKDANGAPRWLTVVRNLQLAEAFTQYDNKMTCFLDIAKIGVTRNLPANKELLGPACVGASEILAAVNPANKNKAHKELHYDGLRWMSVYGKTRNETEIRGRKGEKLVLWSAIQAGNYIYLIEYAFTDDGRVVSRLGFTAHNFFKRRNDEGDVHPHIGCWRLDFDLGEPGQGGRRLGGPEHNDLSLVSRVFDKGEGRFKIDSAPFSSDARTREAREGKAKWVAAQFTTLRATSRAVTNSNGKPIAYDLISTRAGTCADLLPIGNAQGLDMDFINYDFWVTRTPTGYKNYHELPAFAANLPLKGQRTTVWHSVPGLHTPRDEDYGGGGADNERGVALTSWVEFALRPRNLFDSTPLYEPLR